jgi:hypothetical protein
MQNSGKSPVHQKSEADEDTDEDQKTPTGPQPAGVQEYLSHLEDALADCNASIAGTLQHAL